MKGYTFKQIMSPDFDLPGDRAGLEAVYRTLAKTADQRLVRLEQVAGDENFKNASRWAYARAMRDIKEWGGEEATRFNIKPPEGNALLEAKIEDIKTFLASPTSTKKGIKNIMQKRADTLNKKFGTNFKWDEVGRFFESSLNEDLDKRFGSKTKLRAVAQMQKNKKKIIEGIEKANEIDIQVPDDKMVEKLVNKALKALGPEVADYLKGKK